MVLSDLFLRAYQFLYHPFITCIDYHCFNITALRSINEYRTFTKGSWQQLSSELKYSSFPLCTTQCHKYITLSLRMFDQLLSLILSHWLLQTRHNKGVSLIKADFDCFKFILLSKSYFSLLIFHLDFGQVSFSLISWLHLFTPPHNLV